MNEVLGGVSINKAENGWQLSVWHQSKDECSVNSSHKTYVFVDKAEMLSKLSELLEVNVA